MGKIVGNRLKSIMTWTIILLITMVFVFFGLNDYFSASHASIIAKVAGHKITEREVERLYERLVQQGNGLADTEGLKQQAVNALMRRAALLNAISGLGLVSTDQQLAQMLLKIPAFQVEGQFSKDEYQKRLKESGYSDAVFRKELSEDICLTQLERAIVQSDFTTPQELNRMVEMSEEKRDVGYVLLPADYGLKEIQISESAIQDYYEKQKQDLIQPERVSIDYILLSPEDAIKKVSISADDISQYYESHALDYTLPERVHARHLLITAPEGDIAADKASKARALDLLSQIQKGADLATLAKQYSEDPGSAPKGGDLGWFSKGQMVPEFEKAAFALKPGAVSELVRSPFGYHIIQLIAHKNSEVRPLNVVESTIREQLKIQKAQELFEKESETFQKLVKESPRNLEDLAAALGLSLVQTQWFSPEGAEGVLSDSILLKAAFAPSFLKEGYITAPLQLSNQALLVMRLKQHEAARAQTLDEAAPQIQKILRQKMLRAQLKDLTQAFTTAIAKGEDLVLFAKERGLMWQTKDHVSRTLGLDRELGWVAFQVPVAADSKKIAYFKLSDGRFVIMKITKVIPGQWSSLNEKMQQEYRQGLAMLWGQMNYFSMMLQILETTSVQWMSGFAPK